VAWPREFNDSQNATSAVLSTSAMTEIGNTFARVTPQCFFWNGTFVLCRSEKINGKQGFRAEIKRFSA
jgi:hypothetical protein